MEPKRQRFNLAVSILAMAAVLALGLSSVATAQEPVWADEYVGDANAMFGVNGCGREKETDNAVVNLWGPDDNLCDPADCPLVTPFEYGSWGITIEDPDDPTDQLRIRGSIDAVSGNGKNLYLDFFQGVREDLSATLQAWKGDVCEIASPLPDEVIWRQARAKTNKAGTKVKVKFRAKYPAIVNEGGHTKSANFRLNINAETVVY